MNMLIISILLSVIFFVIFIPVEKISSSKNLHKLIIYLGNNGKSTDSKDDTYRKRFFNYSEKFYRKLNIKINKEKYMRYKDKLILAGVSEKINVESFIGSKIICSIIAFIYFGLLALIDGSYLMYLLMMIGIILGYYCSDSIISIKIKKRQQELQKELPNILKNLAITTEAGLNFWEAVEKVCEIRSGVLIEELKKMLDEIRMGVLQKEALTHLAERCKVTEITLFVFAVIQSIEKGSTGITKALKEQANEAWQTRKNKAKEMGQKASIKLFFSMLIFVFPSLLIFLLGPAILSIMKLFINN